MSSLPDDALPPSHLAERLQKGDPGPQARLLSALLLAIILLGVLAAAVTILFQTPTTPLQLRHLPWIGGAVALAGGLRWLNRAGRFRLAAWLLTALSSLLIFLAAVPDSTPADVRLLYYLALPVLLGSLLLGARASLVLAVASTLGMVLYPALIPDVTPAEIITGPLLFHLSASALIVIAVAHAARLEKAVQARTAQLRAERDQSTTILDNVADAVLLTDLDARVLYVNPAWERLTGYSAAEALGQNPRFLQSGDTPRATYEQLWAAILAGKVWRGVLRNRRKDGSLFDAELTVAPVLDEQGQPQSFVGVQRDVTEARRLEAMKTRFIANASHELRTPITNVKLNVYLMRQDPRRLAEYLDILEYEAERLKTLVEDMLDTTRFEQGAIKLVRRQVDLLPLLQDVIAALRPHIGAKPLRLRTELAARPLPVWADPDRLTQVFTNLLVNAIRYTPPHGQITVHLRAEREHAVARIRDTGAGIAPALHTQIFEPFFRANEDNSRGSGLGLTIAREIVALHGGQIEVESEEGRGSTFTVRLALLRDAADADRDPDARGDERTSDRKSASGEESVGDKSAVGDEKSAVGDKNAGAQAAVR